MNILVLGEIEASGEWIALQEFVRLSKKKNNNLQFFLVAYGNNKVLLDQSLFLRIKLLDYPFPTPPIGYYRQIIKEFIIGYKAIKTITEKRQFSKIIVSDFRLLYPAKTLMKSEIIYLVQGFRYRLQEKKIKSMMRPFSFNIYFRLRKFIERLIFLLSDRIVVPSNFTKKEVLSESFGLLSKSKISVIQNPIRREFYDRFTRKDLYQFKTKKKIPQNKKIIVYCGLISPRKKIKEVIIAFNKLNAKRKDLILVISFLSVKCNIPYKESFTPLLNPSIIFIQDLNSKELSKLFQISFVAIYPSDHETYGNVFKEAIMSGLPILATKTGLVSDIQKKFHKYLILKDNTSGEIYQSIKRLLEAPVIYKQIKNHEIKKLQEYFRKNDPEEFARYLN